VGTPKTVGVSLFSLSHCWNFDEHAYVNETSEWNKGYFLFRINNSEETKEGLKSFFKSAKKVYADKFAGTAVSYYNFMTDFLDVHGRKGEVLFFSSDTLNFTEEIKI
jgi:hypothetical protein